MTEDSDYKVPDTSPIQFSIDWLGEQDALQLTIRHKDDPLGTQVALTIDQAAGLQALLDDILDDLENRPETRVRTEDVEQKVRGIE